jgi:hypothetical protein
MPTRSDFQGQKIGDLTVLSWDDLEKKWIVVCKNGHYSKKNSSSLKRSTQCKHCYWKKLPSYKRTHGKTNSKVYNSWRGMKDRVLNENHYGHKWYKAKGITICEQWMRFDNFLNDMGEPPPGTTLDRIDNNKGYYKENCRWVSMKIQRRNRSDSKRFHFGGHQKTLAEWSESTGIPYKTLRSRIQEGWTIERALKTPLKENPATA